MSNMNIRDALKTETATTLRLEAEAQAGIERDMELVMPLYRGPWAARERGSWRCTECCNWLEADDFRCDCANDEEEDTCERIVPQSRTRPLR